MGRPHSPQKVKLIVGLIFRDTGLTSKINKRLEALFRNRVDFESGLIDFVHTDYYEKEMGKPLKRKFLSFEKLVDLKNIYRVKSKTNLLESAFSRRGKRRINIDPGYLDLSKVILFSTKDYTHRIYLDGGIFAEVTLHFKGGTYNPWPWTYPDYQTKEYVDIFNTIRKKYKTQLVDHDN